MGGPLEGVRVIEVAGIGPGPFAAMILSDLGADVLRVDRSQAVKDEIPAEPPRNPSNRGRRSIGVDLKNPDGVEALLRLVEGADVLLEGFRPGVAERLGIGPDVCRGRNPRLVYGRMTGWGQDGPYAPNAGHDINYIALSGALHAIGRKGQNPTPPLNLVGDFGGGGMLLALGIACALVERARSGEGQVVDAAMVDGAALLTTMFYAQVNNGTWGPRGTNTIDSGAHYYDTYETSDGKYVSIGSIEPQFYAELRRLMGLDEPEWDAQHDSSGWPALKEKIAARFKEKTRDEWCEILESSPDVCFAPVLSFDEAHQHPHNAARGTFTTRDGMLQPAPAPRFSRTPGEIAGPPAHPGQHTDDALVDWGFTAAEVAKMRDVGAVR